MKPLKFFTDAFDEKESNVIFFGVDYTKDSKKMLKKIRKASLFVEPLDAEFKSNLIKNVKMFDLGDKKIKNLSEISKIFESIKKRGKIPFMFSRGHLATYYTTKTLDDETKIIVFDAHADMKDEYMDEIIRFDSLKNNRKKFNGATWLRRLSEIYNPKHIMVLGIRSFDEEELDYMKERGILFYTSYEIKNKLEDVRVVVREFTKLSNVYISLDIDVFDPSIAPAVDYPEPDGINFYQFKKLVESVSGNITGMDVVCFKPIEDNLITEFLLVKSVFALLSRI